MFYYFSKVFDFLIMPYNLALIALIVVFFSMQRGWKRWMVGFVILFLYIQSNALIAGRMLQIWSYPGEIREQTTYDAGIVLSGGLVGTCNATGSGYDLQNGSDRLLTGFILYKRGVCKKLILTGTDFQNLLVQGRGEVQMAKKLLIEWGVKPEDVILETRARNTYENVLYTSEILQSMPESENLLLITSGYHMRRARACFKKAGINADAYPADSEFDSRCLGTKMKLLPTPAAVEAFSRIWKEWIGMVAYKIAGYC